MYFSKTGDVFKTNFCSWRVWDKGVSSSACLSVVHTDLEASLIGSTCKFGSFVESSFLASNYN